MRHLVPVLLPWLITTSPGCATSELSQSWQLDRLRILAVRAEPAEPSPGETTVMSAYVYWPGGTEGMTLWFACLPSAAGDFGCTLDPAIQDQIASVDIETATPEELAALFAAAQEAGLVGVEPYFSPEWTPDAAALDELEPADQLEGLSAIVNITAMPQGATDESEIELAYKRIPVSLATTPNHNPDIVGWRINGTDWLFDDTGSDALAIESDPGQPWDVEPILSADSAEDYSFVTSDGVEETRTEQPYFTFYVEDGSFDQSFSLYDPDVSDSAQVQWTAPSNALEGRIVAVVRDRRGGMDWAEVPVSVR